jgi:hypothetical protein
MSSAVSHVELRPEELKLELRYSWLEHTQIRVKLPLETAALNGPTMPVPDDNR